ncbi:hypothetical protein [Caudoviricetes sp.]|nr:hypothetical protein [Caudoviricetes sp.]
MAGSEFIEVWECYVSGDGLRVARNAHGECVSVTKEGALACDDAYVPPAVFAWLIRHLASQGG